jgi:dGTPase
VIAAVNAYECGMTRALYASDPARSRGRLYPESASTWRSEFLRDRDRIIHASAFRRLKHKTQVFVSPEGDHYRTRLTHSLEVAQIARTIARVLNADEDLTEALALSHDLGHTAFGHAGEDALHAKMRNFGGFDHNAQSLRIVTHLEQRHLGFDGLNLTWETLEGLVKHNGPLITATCRFEDLPWAIRDYSKLHDLHLSTYASVEAQIAAIADDIAYNAHDLDDGLRAGMFLLEDACTVPLLNDIFVQILKRAEQAQTSRLTAELMRDLIGIMVSDVLDESRRRLSEDMPDTFRNASRPMIAFSAAFQPQERSVKTFLRQRMYQDKRLARRSALAETVISGLFDAYLAEPETLPAHWAALVAQAGEEGGTRHIADFIAGMTDRYAVTAYEKLFGHVPAELRDDGLTI